MTYKMIPTRPVVILLAIAVSLATPSIGRAEMVEEIMAWVQLAPGAMVTEEDLRDFCRGNIAHFKVPRYVTFVSEFPMTVTGKVRKVEMREKAIADLGLEVTETA